MLSDFGARGPTSLPVLHFERLADQNELLVMKRLDFRVVAVILFFVLVESTRLPKLPDRISKVGDGKRTADPVFILAASEDSVPSSPLATRDNLAMASTASVPQDFERLRFSVLSILLPWLYFMSTSLNIPTLPKFVNAVINKGNNDVSELSAKVYGNIAGIDAFFTFLSVNLVGCLSDYYGRRPFMFLSSLGLGAAYLLTSFATQPGHFYLAACLDGLTSCMLSQSQAYITDHHDSGSLSIALSRFQGIAIGMAFMIGIPLGAVIAARHSLRTPLRVAVTLCAANCGLIATLLPRSPKQKEVPESCNSTRNANGRDASSVSTVGPQQQLKKKGVNWAAANPLGAAVMLTRTRKLLSGSMAYFLLNVAHCGVQVVWINYLQRRFGMSQVASGSTLMVVGVVVATLPQLVIPRIGTVNAFKYGILLHALSVVFLALTDSRLGVFLGMPFLAAGASSLPVLLGYLTDQVERSEVGALQGAADTVRTVAGILGAPLVSRVFGHCISGGRDFPGGALLVASAFSFLGYIFVAAF